MLNWTIITGIATILGTAAYIITALYIRAELKALEKDRYLTVTSQLFDTWQSPDFMTAQLWLLHRLEHTTWAEFVAAHRADAGEVAFHRVGSFYDRIGTLVRLGLVDEREILSTMGAYAIGVWQKIEPLVKEARRLENSVLFEDFERLLPACYECYVPGLGGSCDVHPFSLQQPSSPGSPALVTPAQVSPPSAVEREAAGEAPIPSVSGPHEPDAAGKDPRKPGGSGSMTIRELKRRLDRQEPVSVLDVRFSAQVGREPEKLPGALWIPAGEIEIRWGELPYDRETAVYCA